MTWTAPPANGLAVTSYTVTTSPGGATCTTSSLSCTIAGLTTGDTYTFAVVATNAIGTSPSSAASNAVILATAPAAQGNTTSGRSVATPRVTGPIGQHPRGCSADLAGRGDQAGPQGHVPGASPVAGGDLDGQELTSELIYGRVQLDETGPAGVLGPQAHPGSRVAHGDAGGVDHDRLARSYRRGHERS